MVSSLRRKLGLCDMLSSWFVLRGCFAGISWAKETSQPKARPKDFLICFSLCSENSCWLQRNCSELILMYLEKMM